MKRYKHLLFDLDRTLWDFETNARKTLHEMYIQFRVDRYCAEFEDFASYYKKTNERLWADYRDGEISKDFLSSHRFTLTFQYFGLDEPGLGKIAGEFYLEKSAEKTNLFEGAIETLEKLKPHYNIHIITNGFKSVQEKKIRNSGLGPYIDSLITSEDVGYQKPDARVFAYALQQINAASDECVMIGDDEKTDIKGAHDSKIDSVWFNPAKRDPELGIIETQIASLPELCNLF